MATFNNEKRSSTRLPKKEEIEVILQHWTRISNIKLGWIYEFDKLVVNYVMFYFLSFIQMIISSPNIYLFVDYSTFDGKQLICSGSYDKTACVWEFDNNKQIQSFKGHSDCVKC
ncbi:hypothetical protein RFI_31713, partial [Reticulomyxa filosa]